MDTVLNDLGEFIQAALADLIHGVEVRHGELAIVVDRGDIVRTLKFLRDDPNCDFRQLVDITAVDRPEKAERFEIVYNLLSLTHNRRIRVKIWVSETTPAPSITSLFSSADWYEREVWDLFGVFFDGHSDLRRILSDYGFQGHPLRKDFPLTGYVEVRYDDEQKRVVYEPVKLPQEYRSFDFLSPWEGMTRLPGDEKAEPTES